MHKWVIAAFLTTLCGGLIASEPIEVEPLEPFDSNGLRQVKHRGGGVDGWLGIRVGMRVVVE